jgi:hypothetical protein
MTFPYFFYPYILALTDATLAAIMMIIPPTMAYKRERLNHNDNQWIKLEKVSYKTVD